MHLKGQAHRHTLNFQNAHLAIFYGLYLILIAQVTSKIFHGILSWALRKLILHSGGSGVIDTTADTGYREHKILLPLCTRTVLIKLIR